MERLHSPQAPLWLSLGQERLAAHEAIGDPGR